MRIVKLIFSPVFMGFLLVVFAITMALATFIENDFGPAVAYKYFYSAVWFELLLLLLALNLIGQMIQYKLFRKEKITIALFHLSFILMIAGAGITRYFGWEGSVHIREGDSADTCLTDKRYLTVTVRNKKDEPIYDYSDEKMLTYSSAGRFSRKIIIGNRKYELLLARIIPNAARAVAESADGKPVISLLVAKGTMPDEEVILGRGEKRSLNGLTIGFEAEPADILIEADSAGFLIIPSEELRITDMMTRQTNTIEADTSLIMRQMQIYSYGDMRIVARSLQLSGVIKPEAKDPEEIYTGMNAYIFHLVSGNESKILYLWENDAEPSAAGSLEADGNRFSISYGSRQITLPFGLTLNDFILERYPGSASPSGYRSEIILTDKEKQVSRQVTISMNNILKYRGYRFFQSSYDGDEQGTILSVNHDLAGMLVTYTGYGFLFLFIIISLVNRASLFRTVRADKWSSRLRKAAYIFLLLFLMPGRSQASTEFIPGRKSSWEFGKVLVQDQNGRTKPLYTLSNDILRKVTRQNRFNGLSAMQVFAGIYLDFEEWKDVPLIKISDSNLQKTIGIAGNMASFSDLVDTDGDGRYVLAEEVNTAYARPPEKRSKTDKEVMKVDERVNIIYMIYRGDFLRIFPVKDGTHTWLSPSEALKNALDREDSIYLSGITSAITKELQYDNINNIRQITKSIGEYQERFSDYSLPGTAKVKAELLYYRSGIFEKLFPFYASAGLIMLIGLIILIIRDQKYISGVVRILSWLLFAGFLFHTFALVLRWYISGHSPMSNGYESMIFISWVTLLAGLFFRRRSAIAFAATGILAGMTLMVAHLSFMDPEITNLVPVLKSYWLTLHVSVITGSYGFLGLGALIGAINILLVALSGKRNREKISHTIDELTIINFRSLTLGLYFLTIGTFLGAVWANESWGRYWGWDPKETWSLITIIVYTFIVHSRMIPGLRDIFTFNLLSLLGFSSVLMTYFGVNYYLSGLHSYASGDPLPVPGFMYFSLLILCAIVVAANLKYRGINHKGKV